MIMPRTDLKGKKLLILAGAEVHVKVVDAAKELGIYTIVTDYLQPEFAPAKKVADEYWMLDINDVEGIVHKCTEEKVDGVLTFCIDPAQKPYQAICERLGVPCYGTKQQFEILTDKRLFKDYCSAHSVGIIPEYSLDDALTGKADYPVLVKPSISRGSRGQTVCYSDSDVPEAIDLARRESGNGEVIIERYMLGKQDMSFAYAVIDGEPYLIKCGDRILGRPEDKLDRQQIATVLPSSHSEQYVSDIEPVVKEMIKSLGFQFGAVFFQGFWENGSIYMYDPGLRFPGSDYDLVVKSDTGYDNMKTFVYYAMTGDTKSSFGSPKEAYRLGGKACLILSIALRPGRVASISGFEVVASHPWVYSASLRCPEGTVIPDSGDIKQRAAEFIVALPDIALKDEFLSFVYQHVSFLDDQGDDMIVSKVETSNLR